MTSAKCTEIRILGRHSQMIDLLRVKRRRVTRPAFDFASINRYQEVFSYLDVVPRPQAIDLAKCVLHTPVTEDDAGVRIRRLHWVQIHKEFLYDGLAHTS
jgi:hypothetical protein